MPTDIYSSFFIQMVLFSLLAIALLVSVISLFIKPAKRTIRASLVEASTGHIIDISQFETSIGRAKTCDVVIADMSVSRFHAVLSRRSADWIIFDTNSTSGTAVNGGKIDKKYVLKDGDHINFGSSEFIFYSTAVTTRQQMVPKTRKNTSAGQRNVSSRVTKKRSRTSDGASQYRTPAKNYDTQQRTRKY